MRITLYCPKTVESHIQTLLPPSYTVVQGLGYYQGVGEEIAIYTIGVDTLYQVQTIVSPIIQALLEAGEECVYYEVDTHTVGYTVSAP